MFLCRSSFNFNVCVFRQVAALYTSVIHHRYLRNHKRVCVELSPCPLSELSGLCTPTQLRHFSVDCKREVDDPGKELKCKDPVDASDSDTEQVIRNDVMVVQDFLNEAEEETLFNEIEPHLKRLRYEVNHWDDAICGYRETERKHWSEESKKILKRVQQVAFPPGEPILPFVHVLDLQKTGLSLLSSSIMRFVNEKDKDKKADVLLGRRSLYVMSGVARYEYTHEILPDELSVFKGVRIPRDRRISVISRNEVLSP
ncbi:hypothetical protein LSH36_145g03039 [Paralvinella palmiformis]|uniref:Alpha-ketoglutarate-dependent dioxygenase alkB homolog 7, mitochondrial n=1 Tax=Paralvinella palmiformis TaxID=53620 RepID=A0AAD9JV82_9ANNE|nr:hypothetical protein LSH36_145g03039 [Paralvinella palmiformis]